MADMTKQRLIGALLVLAVILIAALVLVKNANDNIDETSEVALPKFESSIQSSDSEIIDVEQETLIDPHNLGDDVAATINDNSVREAVTTKVDAVINEIKPVAEASKPEVKPMVIPEKKVAAEKKAEPKKQVVQETKPPTKAKLVGPQWIIQLASFGVKDNVEALQKKVKKLGYIANIQAQAAINSQDKLIYRLRIGPESDPKKVEVIVSKMKQHLQLTPQIIKLQ
jgi:cell division septation protein DedD